MPPKSWGAKTAKTREFWSVSWWSVESTKPPFSGSNPDGASNFIRLSPLSPGVALAGESKGQIRTAPPMSHMSHTTRTSLAPWRGPGIVWEFRRSRCGWGRLLGCCTRRTRINARARGCPQHGRQMPFIDIIECHDPGPPLGRWLDSLEPPAYAPIPSSTPLIIRNPGSGAWHSTSVRQPSPRSAHPPRPR